MFFFSLFMHFRESRKKLLNKFSTFFPRKQLFIQNTYSTILADSVFVQIIPLTGEIIETAEKLPVSLILEESLD